MKIHVVLLSALLFIAAASGSFAQVPPSGHPDVISWINSVAPPVIFVSGASNGFALRDGGGQVKWFYCDATHDPDRWLLSMKPGDVLRTVVPPKSEQSVVDAFLSSGDVLGHPSLFGDASHGVRVAMLLFVSFILGALIFFSLIISASRGIAAALPVIIPTIGFALTLVMLFAVSVK